MYRLYNGLLQKLIIVLDCEEYLTHMIYLDPYFHNQPILRPQLELIKFTLKYKPYIIYHDPTAILQDYTDNKFTHELATKILTIKTRNNAFHKFVRTELVCKANFQNWNYYKFQS